jgi:hypothetical protein
MTYGFIQDVPATLEMYDQIRDGIGDETPPGLISHVAIEREGGLRYVDVWETEEDWERFRQERLEPVVGKVLAAHGLEVDHSQVVFDPVTVLDTWIGQTG